MKIAVVKILVLGILVLPIFNNLKAGIEPDIRNSITGSTIAPTATFVNYDPVFLQSNGTTTAVNPYDYHRYKVSNTVQLEVNQATVKDCPISSWWFKVAVTIHRKNEFGTNLSDITDTLRINYDATSGVKYRDIHIHNFDSTYWMEVVINSITSSISFTSLRGFVTLAAITRLERYKDINLATVPTFNALAANGTDNIVEFSWDAVDGAEEYDLEYTYVDDYDEDGSELATSSLPYSFRNDATRVTTNQTSYAVTPGFERGYLLVRVRAVGKTGTDFDQRMEGAWSNSGYSAFVNAFTLDEDALRLYEAGTIGELNEYESGFNWQYSVTFAEEGKKKEVISYMDGSFRNRQSVTRNNTENMAIVGENIYDHMGRPTISILPVPAFDNYLGYHPDFNLNTSGDPYSKADFDLSENCTRSVDSISYLSGAGKYYSAGNTRVADIGHQYIPDAFGYPLAVTELMPDATGRVKRQGGVGMEHQLGSGHETKYFYGVPFQEEIDRLFGNSVGYNDHYEKNMVVDPNGQVSVSYLDLKGRVIATALAGESPANMSQVSTYESAHSITTSLLSGTDTLYEPDAIAVLKTFNVAVTSDHTFDYALDIPRFTPSGTSFCYDCVYDLVISLTDECGNEMLDGNPGIAGNQPITRTLGKPQDTVDVDCETGGLVYSFSTDDSLDNDPITINLAIGTYTLKKTLRVNMDAADYYAAHYLTNKSGLKVLEDFETEYISKIDYSGCSGTCEECLERIGTLADYLNDELNKIIADSIVPDGTDSAIIINSWETQKALCDDLCALQTSNCELFYERLLMDVSPGGQYAPIYTVSGSYVYGGILDEFGYDSAAEFNYVWERVTSPSNYLSEIEYKDINNQQIYANVYGELKKPGDLSAKDFVKYFQHSWAEVLVKFHPEYCKYQKCLDDAASEQYDFNMLKTETYAAALDSGFLNPLGEAGVDFTENHNDPFWISGSGSGSLSTITDKIHEYVQPWDDDPECTTVVSIWELAYLSYICGKDVDCTDGGTCLASMDWDALSCKPYQDVMWQMYRALYLASKAEIKSGISGYNCSRFSSMSSKDTVFKDINDAIDLIKGSTASLMTIYAQADLYAQCDSQCFYYADYWMHKLDSCDLTSTDSAALRAEFIAICRNGCSGESPTGATSVMDPDNKRISCTYNSFEEAFNDYVAQSKLVKRAGLCDVNLISEPRPYGHSYSPWETDTSKCTKFARPGDSCVNYGDDNYDRKKAVGQTLQKVDSTSCRRCVNCEKVREAVDSLYSFYGDNFQDTSVEIHFAVRNYLNNWLNLNLDYQDYLDFMRLCNDDSLSIDDSVISGYRQKYIQPIYDVSFAEPSRYLLDDLLQNEKLQYASNHDIFELGEKVNNRNLQGFYASLSSLPPSLMPELKRIQPCRCNELAAKWAQFLGSGHTVADSNTFNDSISNLCWEVSPSQPAFNFYEVLKKCQEAYDSDERNPDPFTSSSSWTSIQKNTLENLFYSSEDGLWLPLCDAPCNNPDIDGDPEDKDSSNPFYFRIFPPGDDHYYGGGGCCGGGSGGNIYQLSCDSFRNWLDSMQMFAIGMGDIKSDLFSFMYRNKLPIYLDPLHDLRTAFYTRFPHAARDTFFQDPIKQLKDFLARYAHCLDTEFDYMNEENCCYRLNEYGYRLFKLFQAYAGQKYSKPYNHFVYNGWDLVSANMDEYYNTILYTNGHQADLYNLIKNNKMPSLDFILTDEGHGDTSRVILNYSSNYSNKAFFGRIFEITSLTLKSLNSCDTTHYFQLQAMQNDKNGDPIPVVLNGWVEKYKLVDTCGPAWPNYLLCDKEQKEYYPTQDPCSERLEITARYKARMAYEKYVDSIKNSIKQAYIEHCRQAWHDETFTMTWDQQEYHYTLYYYDQANNLIQTIPPDGVNPLTSPTDLTAVKTARASNTTGTFPTHTFKTRYKFNTLNQLIWQTTPDAGVSKFWYDNVGRLVMSQNAKQANDDDYSYTTFDGLGRIVEVGALNATDTMSWAIAFDPEDLEDFIDDGTKREVTATFYDQKITSLNIPGLTQANLRSRVSSMTYEETYDGYDSTYDYGVHYSYDFHGIVPVVMRENRKLKGTFYRHHQFKRMDYDYDLHSGKVNSVVYQDGKDDQFVHEYNYDGDLRLTSVYAGPVKGALDREAAYSYYLHGPLMRSEIGDLSVQGVDFAYTLHGWIKGVNSGTLKTDRDIGQDAESGSDNEMVAKDVYGYSLGYYRNDYTAIGLSNGNLTTTTYFMPDLPTNSNYHSTVPELWNGNIRHMITAIEPFLGTYGEPQGMSYTYDQLNRIVSSRAWSTINVAGNTWQAGGGATDKYKEDYTYDGNGNILTLKRYAVNSGGTGRAMDYFGYNYYSGTNQLNYVSDTVNANAFTQDIDNQTSGNYHYDEIGNLVDDASEEIQEIEWNVYGKIKSVTRTMISTKPDLEFEYDPMGNRVLKRVITKGMVSRTIETLYIRDANGNEMASYTLAGDSVTWNSASIYGSSRLGLYEQDVLLEVDSSTRITLPADEDIVWRGYRKYELSNHLGNVLVVISDKRTTVCDGSNNILYYEADIVSAQDYYPFGMVMPGKEYASQEYKFGFNDKQKEANLNPDDYDFGSRIYDGKLGRWLSVDPLHFKFPSLSPFVGIGNNPILFIDKEGKDIVIYYSWVDEKGAKVTNEAIRISTDIDIDITLTRENLAQVIPAEAMSTVEGQLQNNSVFYEGGPNVSKMFNALWSDESIGEEIPDAYGGSISFGGFLCIGGSIGFDFNRINRSGLSSEVGKVGVYFTWSFGNGVAFRGVSATNYDIDYKETNTDVPLSTKSFKGYSYSGSIGFAGGKSWITAYVEEDGWDADHYMGMGNNKVLYDGSGFTGGIIGLDRVMSHSTYLGEFRVSGSDLENIYNDEKIKAPGDMNMEELKDGPETGDA